MARSGDNHSGGKHGSNKDPENYAKEVGGLLEKANAHFRRRSSHGGVQRASLLAREELKEIGIAPTHLLLEIMQVAFQAFQEQKGAETDPGSAYLSIATKCAETLAKYTYPTMKAVQISVEEGAKTFDATDPKQILDAVIDDPFFTDEQRLALINKLKVKTIKIEPNKDLLPVGAGKVEE